MIRRHYLVEIKRVKELLLSTLSPPHHGSTPANHLSIRRNHGSPVASTTVLQHIPPQSGHRSARRECPLSAKSALTRCSKKDRYSIPSSARVSSVGGTSRGIRGTGGYGISGGPCGRHAGLRPANFQSLVHLATSSARNLRNSMGEVEKVLPPKSAYFALISCLCSPVLISPFSKSMIADGVFLGAPIPAHELISYPGRNSATAGTSGIAGEREAPVIAKARS